MSDSVWVSCSAGVDSIAVAHYILNKLKRDVRLFHFNHGNGEINDKMERCVLNFAQKFNLRLEIRRLQSHNETNNLESYYREKRYEGLQEVCGSGDVILGHHLNDCVENYLMNCFNGVGEYCPIPIRTHFGLTRIIRPFMLTQKKAFENYIEGYGLKEFICEDPSNSNTKFRRNWIRNRIIPILEEGYPGLEKVVLKKMKAFYEDI